MAAMDFSYYEALIKRPNSIIVMEFRPLNARCYKN